MPIPVESGSAFVYSIPIPSVSRKIALSFATFFLLLFCYLPFKLGLTRSINSMVDDPFLWLIIVAMFGSGIAFFLVLAFPPINWRARIETTRDSIRYFPRPPLRWMGEPTAEIRVGMGIREVLICQGSQDRDDGAFGSRAREYAWGYRIVVRSEENSTQEIKVSTGDRLNVRQAEVLSKGIARAVGVPVRFIKREPSDSGGVREVPWVPISRSVNLIALAKLAFIATPFIGGLTVGIARPNGVTVIAVGVCLWLLQTSAVFIYATISRRWSKFGAFYWLTTIVSFASSYAVIFFFTANLVHGH